jgi:hypothetical protein
MESIRSVRLELVADYVRLSARIERLGAREDDAELGNVQISRAMNVATGERRRLHAALFAGANKPRPTPTPAEIAAKNRKDQAYAWFQFWHGGGRKVMTEAEADAREKDLMLLYGEPSWSVMAVPPGSSPEFAKSMRDVIDGPS